MKPLTQEMVQDPQGRMQASEIHRGDHILTLFKPFPMRRKCRDPLGLLVLVSISVFHTWIVVFWGPWCALRTNNDHRRLAPSKGSDDDPEAITMAASEPTEPVSFDDALVDDDLAPSFQEDFSEDLSELDSQLASRDVASLTEAQSLWHLVFYDRKAEPQTSQKVFVMLTLVWMLVIGGFFSAILCCVLVLIVHTEIRSKRWKEHPTSSIATWCVSAAFFQAVLFILGAMMEMPGNTNSVFSWFIAPAVVYIFVKVVWVKLPPASIRQRVLVNFKAFANDRERDVSYDIKDATATAGVIGVATAKSMLAFCSCPLPVSVILYMDLSSPGGKSYGRLLSSSSSAGSFLSWLLFIAGLLVCVFEAALVHNICFVTHCHVLASRYRREVTRPSILGSLGATLTTSLGSVCAGTLKQVVIRPCQILINRFESKVVIRPSQILINRFESKAGSAQSPRFPDVAAYGNCEDWGLVQCAIRGLSVEDARQAAMCLLSRPGLQAVIDAMPVNSFACLGGIGASIVGINIGTIVGYAVGGERGSITAMVVGAWTCLVAGACVLGVHSAGARVLVSLWAEDPALVRLHHPMTHKALKELLVAGYVDETPKVVELNEQGD